jgi:hypothetical protein
MRLDSPVVAFPAWLGGSLTPHQRGALKRTGKPRPRATVNPSAIQARRYRLGLTRQAVADRLGVELHAIKRVERRPPHMRGDKRSVALRARMNDLYLSVERGRACA